ncbi:hypothetical protein M8J77_025041 [Diaphorina citri]|nr:hypothetical protein M8J77_025041 [Diaphorina citri]
MVKQYQEASEPRMGGKLASVTSASKGATTDTANQIQKRLTQNGRLPGQRLTHNGRLCEEPVKPRQKHQSVAIFDSRHHGAVGGEMENFGSKITFPGEETKNKIYHTSRTAPSPERLWK